MSSSTQESILKQKVRLDLLLKCIIQHWKVYPIPLVITAIVASLYIVQVPRTYKASVMLAPESSGSSMSGGISGLASMAGIKLNSSSGEDALIPTFYPDLMKSTDFLVPLFNVEVQTHDGRFKGRLGNYLLNIREQSLISNFKNRFFSSKKTAPAISISKNGRFTIDPFKLSKDEDQLLSTLSNSIKCNVDKKTDVITIDVTENDALVAAQLADTLMTRLQVFITEYRTKKSRNDLVYYENLLKDSKIQYEEKQHEYATYVDANQNVSLQSFKSKEESLENEVQLAYTNYSSLKQQVQLAQAKVLEKTPAFTTIQNASVPIKPVGPKRIFFVVSLLFTCFVLVTLFIISKSKEITF